MPDVDLAAYKEAVFGSNGQSHTQPPTPPIPNDEPLADTKLTDTEPQISVTNVEPNSTPISQSVSQDEKPVDENLLIKERLGYDTWDAAKTEIETLRLKASTPAEITYANEQSKLLHEAIVAGKTDEVYKLLDKQHKIAAVGSMSAADAIKLHIQQTHENYNHLDVQDVFEEKYTYPEKPERDFVNETEDDYKKVVEKWEAAKEKVDRRIERDAATAKTELAKLSAELKLPEIQKPQAASTNEEDLKELQRIEAETKEAYSKLSPKDIAMVFKFNDEANKLAFDITYEPDKESLDSAKALASDMKAFFGDYYDKDGSPKRTEFLRDLYAGKNINKIVSEAIVQAVSQERIRALKFQKNIGDGTQKNYVVPPTTDIDRLRQQVFG